MIFTSTLIMNFYDFYLEYMILLICAIFYFKSYTSYKRIKLLWAGTVEMQKIA